MSSLREGWPEQCASTIVYILPWYDQIIGGSLAAYADDTFVSRAVPSGTAEEALHILRSDDREVDAIMAEDGWVQNSKKEI